MDCVVQYSSSEGNDGADRNASMLSIFCKQAIADSDNQFLVETANSALSYRQTWFLVSQLIRQRLSQLSSSLDVDGLRFNPRVILLSHNCTLFPLALWSLWSLSATVVPVSTSADPKLWAAIVDLISPNVIFVSKRLKSKLLGCIGVECRAKIIEIEMLIPEEHSSRDEIEGVRLSHFIPSLLRWLQSNYDDFDKLNPQIPVASISSDTPAVTLFTSSAIDASTLKCVTYTHGMLVRSGTRAMAMLGGDEYSKDPKRHLGWLPLSHCFEFCITLCGTVLRTAGAYIFLDQAVSSNGLPASTPLGSHLLAALEYHQPVHAFCTVPAIFSSMVELSTPADIDRLRLMKSLGVGGAPISETLFQWAADQGIALFDCSGATEAVGTICIRRALVPTMRKNGLQVIPGFMGLLEKGKPDDDFGELIIRATYLPKKYDNRDSEAYSYDSENGVSTYRTGDLYSHSEHIGPLYYLKGETIPEHDPSKVLGGLKYLGRMDDLVVFSSGIKIDALALERTLDANPDVLRSAIVGNANGDALLAYIQPRQNLTKSQLIKLIDFAFELNKTLPFEKRLRKENIFVVEDLPVSTKLTLNRKKLKKLVKDNATPKSILLPQEHRPPNKDLSVSIPSEMKREVELILAEIYSISLDVIREYGGSLADVPLTSLSSIQLAKKLSTHFNVEVSGAQLYGCHTIDDLCRLLKPKDEPNQNSVFKHSPNIPLSANSEGFDLVITGAACRLPGKIDSLTSFWSALLSPETFVSRMSKEPPTSRWQGCDVGEEKLPPIGWLDEEVFSNSISFGEFFGLKPSDVEDMSPNARLSMQVAHEAIEDAGISPKSLSGRRWGVFSCVNDSGWRERRIQQVPVRDYAIGLNGSADDAVGARLSYYLNLKGIAIEVKTACSSSSVAIHQACSAIRNGDCEAAIIVSAVTHFHPAGPLFRSLAGIASPTGRCATFSDTPDGFLPSEGASAIIIQRAGDTRNDPYAIIRASAVAQDGRSRGFFSPNPISQQELLNDAMEKAHIGPDDISYLEAHGTGTRLGDAIEVQAINQVFGAKRMRPLHVGAVKAVVGHTEECAGLIGVLKAIVSFKRNALTPQPFISNLNADIDFEASKIVIPQNITAFVEPGRTRLIGISSFGLSGTLAHIILQEPIKKADIKVNTGPYLYLLSARNKEDFTIILQRHAIYSWSLEAATTDIETACRTTQIGRDHYQYRKALLVQDWRALRLAIQSCTQSGTPGIYNKINKLKIGLWFSLPLLGSSLISTEHPLVSQSLREVDKFGWATKYNYFKQQLAFALSLRALGCNITAVGGEGISEYVAAVFADVFQANDVFRENVQSSTSLLFSVQCSKEELDDLLLDWRSDELSIYGQHKENLFSLVGSKEAATELAKAGATSTPNSSKILMVSGHLGAIVEEKVLSDMNYWEGVTKRSIDSSPAAIAALTSEVDVLVNIGGTIKSQTDCEKNLLSTQDMTFLDIIGRLYELGCNVDWSKISSQGFHAHLPSYQWACDEDFDRN